MIPTSGKPRAAITAIFLSFMTAGLLLAWPPASRGQKPSAPLDPQPLAVRTDVVRVDVSVLDKHSGFAGGLEQSDFRVMDNGVEQPVVFFAPIEAPARVLVMIETSPAVYLIHDEHLAAAYALLQGLDPDDEVGLVTYSDKPRTLLGFTTDKPDLLDALQSLQYTIGMGNLNLYDSLSSVIAGLPPSEGKTAVVLLATGLDPSPLSRWRSLIQKLRGTDVVVFSVALGGALRGDQSNVSKRKKRRPKDRTQEPRVSDSLAGLSGFQRADRALKLLARITGGRAYFPQSDRDFPAIYREIAAALRHQYVLGIVPAHDGKFHALTVTLAARGSNGSKKNWKRCPCRVFAREGYLAPFN